MAEDSAQRRSLGNISVENFEAMACGGTVTFAITLKALGKTGTGRQQEHETPAAGWIGWVSPVLTIARGGGWITGLRK